MGDIIRSSGVELIFFLSIKVTFLWHITVILGSFLTVSATGCLLLGLTIDVEDGASDVDLM